MAHNHSRPLAEKDPIDRIMAMAAALLDAPMAAVAVADGAIRISRSKAHGVVTERGAECDGLGIPFDASGTIVIPDTGLDARVADNPVVTGPAACRFYAGAQVVTDTGEPIGSLCVLDTVARDAPSAQALQLLRMLARQVAAVVQQMKLAKVQSERAELLRLAESVRGLGHWRLDFTTGEILWSDQVYRIHGLDPQAFDPNLHSALSAYHEDDRAEILAHVETARLTGLGYDCHLRIQRPDGELRLTRSSGQCLLGADGKPEVLFGVFQDVTEEDLAARRLAASEARYRLMAENASDIIATYGLDGVFTYVSPAVESALGYRPAELIGKSVNEIVHPDDIAPTWAAFAAYMDGPVDASPPRIAYRARHRSGEVRWLEAHPRAMRDENGQVLEIQDLVRDVSAAKAIELELQRARDEAESAAEAKTEFLANMSHEIRTPLTAILGFSSLLNERSDLPESAVGHLDRIRTASQTLLAIVNDILDFSKIEAGRYEIAREPARALEICHDALLMFSPAAQAKGVSLEFVQETELPEWVNIDPQKVGQVLLNLIGNAVKFTSAGSVTLAVGHDPVSQTLEVRVSDTGPGMSEEQCSRLFQRFSQVDGSSTRRHGGTGLGLAICKGLSEAMGGDIRVASRPGEGSHFTFRIQAAPVQHAPAPAEGEDVVAGGDLAGLRVLVVDDHMANLEIVQALLAPLDIEVSLAASGRIAIDLAATTPYDVVLTDLRMPDVSGEDVVRALRAGHGPNQHIPILAFSADVSSYGATVPGFDGTVAKPVSVAALLAALRSAVAVGADDGVSLAAGDRA